MMLVLGLVSALLKTLYEACEMREGNDDRCSLAVKAKSTAEFLGSPSKCPKITVA